MNASLKDFAGRLVDGQQVDGQQVDGQQADARQAAGPPDAALASLALAQWPGEVALLDPALRVQWINDRFAERIGMDATACRGLDWLALHPTAAIHAPAYERATRGEGLELPPFPAHGPTRLGFFATTLQPLRSEAGIVGLLVTEREVTDAVGEAALEDRRLALLRAVSDGSRDVVTLLDATGGILFAGEPVLTVTGRSVAEVVGRNIFEFVHPEDLDEVRAKMDSGDVLRTPLRMRRVRYRFRHADGGWRWFESLAVNALHDPLLATIIVHSRDVSEEVEHEATLRRRERRFSALTAKSDDLIVVLGADGKAVFESASISRIFGFHPRELTSRRILRLLHPSHRRAAIAVARELLARQGSERRLEFMFRDAGGGYRWLEATLVDLTEDPDVAGVLINARDVTGRKVAEAERDSALESAAVHAWEHDLISGRTRWLNYQGGVGSLGVFSLAQSWPDWLRMVHPDDLAHVRELYANLRDGSIATFNVEYRIEERPGQWQRVMVRGRLVNPAAQGCRLVRGVCIDVTERRRIEDQLARSREQFRVALDCAQIGFYEWDVLGDTLVGLDEWCAARGVPPESGRPGHDARWESLVHPDDLEPLRRSFTEHFAGASQFAEIEYRMRTEDGRWIWVFDRAQVITARTARWAPEHRVVGICMEVERRRRAELGAARDRGPDWPPRSGVPGSACGNSRSDGARARAGSTTGARQEDLDTLRRRRITSTPGTASIHPEDLPRAAALFSDLVEGRHEVYESEYRIRTRSGRWVWIFERSRATERDAGRPAAAASSASA